MSDYLPLEMVIPAWILYALVLIASCAIIVRLFECFLFFVSFFFLQLVSWFLLECCSWQRVVHAGLHRGFHHVLGSNRVFFHWLFGCWNFVSSVCDSGQDVIAVFCLDHFGLCVLVGQGHCHHVGSPFHRCANPFCRSSGCGCCDHNRHHLVSIPSFPSSC